MIEDTCYSRRAVIAGLALAAAGVPSVARAQSTLPTVRLGITANDGFGEAFYGRELGFFTEAGINLDLQVFSSESTILPAVVSESLDVGISSPMTLANAVEKGLKVAYIAAGGAYSTAQPTIALIVAKDNPIRSPKEFEGQSLGSVGLQDAFHLAVVGWLARNGVDVAKVKFISLGQPEMIATIERGSIAGGIVGEPFLSAAIGTTCRQFGKPYDAYGDRALLGGYYARPDYIAANLPILRKFREAMYRTAAWANANRPKSAAILQKYTKISDATLSTMRRVFYAQTLEPGTIQPTLDVAFANKFIDRQIKASELIYGNSASSRP